MAERIIDYPPLSLRATVASVDDEKRTVSLIFSTGASVDRMDYWTGKRYREVLSLDPAHVRLDRLNSGAPVLDAHSAWSVADMLGTVERGSARVEKGQAVAPVRFSRRADVEPVFRDVVDGIITSVSTGYRVHKFVEDSGTDQNAIPVRTAVDWEPFEISMVPMPADTGARVRDGDKSNTNPCVIVRDGAEESTMEGQQTETREDLIRQSVRAAKLGPEVATDLIGRGLTVDEARSAIFEILIERDVPTVPHPASRPPYFEGVHDHTRGAAASTVPLMAEGLAARLGGPAPSEAARPYAHMRFLDLLRELHVQRGGRRDIPDHLLVRGGMHTTSDFPALLTEAGNRMLRAGYDSYQGGIRRIARQTTARDFRPIQKLNLGEAPALLKVGEHGEVTHGSAAEAKETYSIETFARIFSITRQALINDDLNAFGDFSRRQGRAAAELIASELVKLLVSNPVMGDGVALFHATHANLGTAGVISIASLGEGMKLMRRQTGLDKVTPIDVQPRFLVVPASIETVARQTTATITANQVQNVQPFSLDVVVDPRLDGSSAISWYLAADPNAIDTIEFAFLDGAQGPQFETREGFDILGAEMRVVLDLGTGVIDFRGLVKNNGA